MFVLTTAIFCFCLLGLKLRRSSRLSSPIQSLAVEDYPLTSSASHQGNSIDQKIEIGKLARHAGNVQDGGSQKIILIGKGEEQHKRRAPSDTVQGGSSNKKSLQSKVRLKKTPKALYFKNSMVLSYMIGSFIKLKKSGAKKYMNKKTTIAMNNSRYNKA